MQMSYYEELWVDWVYCFYETRDRTMRPLPIAVPAVAYTQAQVVNLNSTSSGKETRPILMSFPQFLVLFIGRQQSCGKVMFQSCVSVCSQEGSLCGRYPWCHWSVTAHMGIPPDPTLTLRSCLNLFNLDLTIQGQPPPPPPGTCFKPVYYVTRTVSMRTVGIRLKCLLVYIFRLTDRWGLAVERKQY